MYSIRNCLGILINLPMRKCFIFPLSISAYAILLLTPNAFFMSAIVSTSGKSMNIFASLFCMIPAFPFSYKKRCRRIRREFFPNIRAVDVILSVIFAARTVGHKAYNFVNTAKKRRPYFGLFSLCACVLLPQIKIADDVNALVTGLFVVISGGKCYRIAVQIVVTMNRLYLPCADSPLREIKKPPRIWRRLKTVLMKCLPCVGL